MFQLTHVQPHISTLPPLHFRVCPVQSLPYQASDQFSTNLQWQTWYGFLPSGAISIHNDYTSRYDYVCKYGCEPGFYNPSLGPHCRYVLSGKEHLGSLFDILVNKDGVELLEWKGGSHGSVPQNSVKACSWVFCYVGTSMDIRPSSFPGKVKSIDTRPMTSMTINMDVTSWHISGIRYNTGGAKVIQYPPETLRMSTIINNECQSVVKKVELSKTNQVNKRWDIGSATTVRVGGSITAQIPFIGSAGVGEWMLALSKMVKNMLNKVSPNHSGIFIYSHFFFLHTFSPESVSCLFDVCLLVKV
uniref:Uncharacterized protein n=1 Tax=Lates calcarifer TaxID=8187 RepID=A0A4W6CSA7_LATCA